MNIKEFRIGSLIQLTGEGKYRIPNSTVFEIIELHAFSFSCVRYDQNPAQIEEWLTFPYTKISLIPLTEEWLIKLGFEGDSIFGSQTLYKNQGIEVWAYRNDKTFLLDNVKRKIVYIKYVHQLQNLYFSLTGEELTIKKTVPA